MALSPAEALLVTLALIVLVPVAVLSGEVILAVVGSRGETRQRSDSGPKCQPARPDERPSLAVIVPAHNEGAIIAATLRSIAPQLHHADRLIVVADNCTDQTASVASSEGAEVVRRDDPSRKGKGYALDHGIHRLRASPPHIVIIVDADCCVSSGAIDSLARECMRTGLPTQALYLMHAPKDPGIKMRIAHFAFVVKNQVRPAGLHRLGLPCQLMGSGMAFPWSLISGSSVATGHITEDLKLGIDLARSGAPPRFCPQSLVTSPSPTSREGIQSQRTRWEHGHLSTILSDVPSLLFQSILRSDGRLLALALDLSVPPLALLSLATSALWAASALLYAFSNARLPLELTTATMVLLTMSVLLSWARYGRNIVSLRDLILSPVYALWKIPLYARFIGARQLDWVRSKRDTDTP